MLASILLIHPIHCPLAIHSFSFYLSVPLSHRHTHTHTHTHTDIHRHTHTHRHTQTHTHRYTQTHTDIHTHRHTDTHTHTHTLTHSFTHSLTLLAAVQQEYRLPAINWKLLTADTALQSIHSPFLIPRNAAVANTYFRANDWLAYQHFSSYKHPLLAGTPCFF